MRRRRRSDCPINFALENFGDRWTLLVLRDALVPGPGEPGRLVRWGVLALIGAGGRAASHSSGMSRLPGVGPHYAEKLARLLAWLDASGANSPPDLLQQR